MAQCTPSTTIMKTIKIKIIKKEKESKKRIQLQINRGHQ
jgi:hypothetical protein